jgi:hypothetical protein
MSQEKEELLYYDAETEQLIGCNTVGAALSSSSGHSLCDDYFKAGHEQGYFVFFDRTFIAMKEEAGELTILLFYNAGEKVWDIAHAAHEQRTMRLLGAFTREHWQAILTWLVAPPSTVLLIGYTVVWILHGFRLR